MIPRRFRNWILVWTPLVWLVLELAMYPKDLPLFGDASIYAPGTPPPDPSVASFLGGFFSSASATIPRGASGRPRWEHSCSRPWRSPAA